MRNKNIEISLVLLGGIIPLILYLLDRYKIIDIDGRVPLWYAIIHLIAWLLTIPPLLW